MNTVNTQPDTARPPQPVVIAAAIAILQSLIAIGFGLFLAYNSLSGAENPSMVFNSSAPKLVGVGSAIFLLICFGFVIFGAVNLVRGNRLGRGAVVLLQFILAASSFQMFSGGAVALGIATLCSAVIVLVLLMFVPASVQWAASHYRSD
ncbi:membrane protein [Corynebacterium phocae]|uniref:Membrane protein n=1 Tax=Corynebacterium phocae TaxID=161895 RepID=A0A1L7D4G9_9CORY|nr:hypothetical protein [Corynebacterium phocae]APT93076.1 membrane protein [Corynebacterium phocae]KAA8722378.1 hypothetical protein F4V58_08945 [Corynebacterium phocae]